MTTGGRNQGKQGVKNLLLLVFGIQMLEAVVRAREREQSVEKRQEPLQVGVDTTQTLTQFFLDLKRVVTFFDVKRFAHDVQDGTVWRALAMGRAMAGEPSDGCVSMRAAKFVEQTGFADTGFTDNADHLPMARLHPGEILAQHRQFALAPHQGGQSAFGIDLQAAAPPLATGHSVDCNRLELPADLDLSQPLRMNIILDQTVGYFGDQNGARLGHGLQACGQIGGVANCRIIHTQVVGNAAHHHHARIEAHAQAHGHVVITLQLAAVAADGFLNGQRGLHGSEGVVFESDRGTKEGHEAVA